MLGSVKDWPDFTRAMLLVGQDDDGNPVGILVDASGNINAILKGQGATGLQTIAVDENGRLEVFVLDSESQWGQVLRIGNAELASRLGSPVAWDWRGQVLVSTDFSDGWPSALIAAAGAGAGAEMSPDAWLHGGFSLKLTGPNNPADYAGVSIRTGPNPASRLGLAVAFACSDTPTVLQLSITYQKGGAGYRSRVRLDFDREQIRVMDHLGVYRDVVEVKPYCNPAYFHSFKFVVDIENGVYVRALLDDVEQDISEWRPVTVGAGSELLTSAVYLYSHEDTNDYAFIDSIVLTSGEPENTSDE